MKFNTIIFIIFGVALLAGAFLVFKPHPKPSPPVVTVIEEAPRTATPMDEYTRFFAKKRFEIDDGKQRRGLTYYWFEPQGKPYPAGLKFPLLVVLHGAPGKAYAAKYLITQKMQLNYPAFIAVPQSPAGKKWAMPQKFTGQEFGAAQAAKYTYHPEAESLPDVVELVSRLAKEYPVDMSRVYIAGCSDGGTGVYGAALRYPQIFAGGVAMSGAWSFADASKLTKMPLLVMHGSEDATFPVQIAQGMTSITKKSGGEILYSEIPNEGHNCASTTLYTKPVWNWLFSQKKK